MSCLSGISQPLIAAYETGARVPHEDACETLLTAIGIRPSDLLDKHRGAIRELLASRGITKVKVFGSVARGTDDEGSDLDLLVEFPDGTTLLDLSRLDDDLEELVGVDVDVLDAAGANPERPSHQALLDEAVPL